ncbi:MAG TPA: AAA family ATPase [Phycisphaerales bacterium]|nr:AAA family ATPase [Phycisphaerales bacterium]
MQSGDSSLVKLATDQVLVIATVVGAAATLPALIEFILEWRKRRERVALSMDDEPLTATSPDDVQLVGLNHVLADIADLIDRARFPQAYRDLKLGNELLILGPHLSGKKTLARRIAQLAGIPRIITIYNPRNSDALAKAKSRLRRKTDDKIALLLPNLDQVFESDAPQSDRDEEVEAELDALIETVANRPNVLIIATASKLTEGDDLDNLFGMKIVLPGAAPIGRRPGSLSPDHKALLREVATHYLKRANEAGCVLMGISAAEAIERILSRAANAAEVEEIIESARTTAIYQQRTGVAPAMHVTQESLEKGIRRVMGA